MKDAQRFENLPKKQQQLIMTAKDLFCRHGVRRVTIEEICRQAKISKMTFYKYFKDKWDIARSVLELLFGQSFQEFHGIVAEELPFSQKFEKLLMMITAQIHAAGSAFLEDLMQESSPLHTYFLEMQKNTRAMSIEFFRVAQESGQINSSIKMPFLLFMLDRLADLVNHPELVQVMPDMEERASELAMQLFHGFARTQT
jgi:AcrR family transcriptional regulator